MAEVSHPRYTTIRPHSSARFGLGIHPRHPRCSLPLADLAAVAAAGTAAGYGSISRYLGILAFLLGRLDESVSHHRHGIVTNERWGSGAVPCPRPV